MVYVAGLRTPRHLDWMAIVADHRIDRVSKRDARRGRNKDANLAAMACVSWGNAECLRSAGPAFHHMDGY